MKRVITRYICLSYSMIEYFRIMKIDKKNQLKKREALSLKEKNNNLIKNNKANYYSPNKSIHWFLVVPHFY